MEAIILAGGRGTRLSGVVPGLPKPMAPVAAQPFLSYLLHWLSGQGFDRVCLSTGHMAEAIEDYYGAEFAGMKIVYVREESPLGTGGAIVAAMASTSDASVFVLNGDSVVVTELRRMKEQHKTNGELVTMALIEVPDTARYGAVRVRDGHVCAFSEKGEAGPGYINAGIYLLRRDCFNGLDLPEVFSFEQQFLAVHLDALQPGAFLADGEFIDIGVPADYERAQTALPRMLGAVEKEKGF